MKASKRNDRHRFSVSPIENGSEFYLAGSMTSGVPYSLSPQLLCQYHCPHSVLPIIGGFITRGTCRSELALIPNDFSIHSPFDHGEKHGLHSTIEFVIFGSEVGSTDIGENSFADKGSQSGGGCTREERKEGLEESRSKFYLEDIIHQGTYSMDVITSLLRNITRFWTRVFLVSGVRVP